MNHELDYGGVKYSSGIVPGMENIDLQHSMVGETLMVDSLAVSLIVEGNEVFLTSDSKIFLTSAGETFLVQVPIPVYSPKAPGIYKYGSTVLGKYYLEELHQVSRREYAMTFLSAVNLLDQSKHLGGIYTGGVAGDVIADIMGTVPYTIDGDVSNIPVYGYLPYDWRRNNLQKVLMAVGGALKTAPDGSLRVTSLSSTVAGTFGEDRVFDGGVLVDKVPATAVQVTEHNYIEIAEQDTLFEGTTTSTEMIIFSEPYHNLTLTGGTLIYSGANYCSFTGAGAVTLTGQKYQHITRVITQGTAPTGSPNDIVKSITDNMLLSPNNATDVAIRLYDYLKVTQSIKADVVFGTERPGDVVSVIHPYTRLPVSATVKSMSVDIGYNELRANTEFLIGYIPPSIIAGFTNYAVLNNSGSWTVPAGITRIRAIICGGGNGGYGGNRGTDGTTSAGGLGGAVGDSGDGGNIFETNLTVTPGQVISFACGAGGAGGTSATAGANGAESSFGAYTSAGGRKYPYGYYEPKSGVSLAEKGAVGLSTAGGNGAPPDGSLVYKGITYTTGATGDTTESMGVIAYGGYGGGPAAGNSGGPGARGHVSSSDGGWIATGGNGGNGANAASDVVAATAPGKGGTGGHGGGGGGMGQSYPFGGGGSGGDGATGGTGGNGRIIVYY